MTKLIQTSINLIQDVYEKVTGIRSAPHLDQFPTAIDTMEMPLVITELGQGTEWYVRCADGRIKLRLASTVYIQAFAQDYYGVIRANAAILPDAIRDKFLDPASYVYDDGTFKLMDTNDIQIEIDPGVPFVPSPYTRIDYPRGSQKWYHGFRLTFGVIASDGAGGC